MRLDREWQLGVKNFKIRSAQPPFQTERYSDGQNNAVAEIVSIGFKFVLTISLCADDSAAMPTNSVSANARSVVFGRRCFIVVC